MQFIRRLIVRLLHHPLFERRAPRAANIPLIVALPLTIHRDVTPTGIRVYSLCGSCGARLEASATLCQECAQGRSRSTPPY